MEEDFACYFLLNYASAIEQKLAALEARMEERFAYIEKELKEMREYVNDMHKVIVEMGKRLAAAETHISNIRNSVKQTSLFTIDTLKIVLASLLSFIFGFLLHVLVTPK